MFEALGSLLSGLGSTVLGEGGMSAVSSFLGSEAFANFAASSGSGITNLLTGDYFGRKQRSKQAKLGYEMANYEAALNYQYSKLYNEQNFDLARRYAQNSAKWAVTGLRNAGLNPILASGSGYNANLGQAGVSSDTSASTPSLNPNGSGMDLAEAMRDFASFRASVASAKQLDSQTDINKQNLPLIRANTAKVNADADRIRSLTKVEVERQKTQNLIDATRLLLDVQRGGDKSPVGTLWNIFGNSDWRNRRNNGDISRIAETLLNQLSNFGRVSTASELIDRNTSSRLRDTLWSSPTVHSAKPRNNWSTEHSRKSINDIDSERMYRMRR